MSDMLNSRMKWLQEKAAIEREHRSKHVGSPEVSQKAPPLPAPVRAVKRLKPKCFLPKSSKEQVVYAVTLVDHPSVVKIGQTRNWDKRRIAYSCWNLRDGDGIADEAVFRINEEYVDLVALEAEILRCARSEMDLYRGLEWFSGDIVSAGQTIERVLCRSGVCFETACGGKFSR